MYFCALSLELQLLWRDNVMHKPAPKPVGQGFHPEWWRKRVKDPDGDYELDLVEEFFSNLDLN